MSRHLSGTLLLALLGALLFPATGAASAQQGDAAYFASFEGLQRIVARAWAAPLTVTESSVSVEINPEGTPIGTPVISTPAATPEPQAGIGALSIFVYLFDADDNAAAGWERIDDDLQAMAERDPRAPMMYDLPLEGVGDEARGYMGDLEIEGVTVTYTFATVLDGPFVYSLTGMFGGVNSAGLTREFAESMVGVPMDRMSEQFHEDGTSRGGIWSKLSAVEPDMPEGSTSVDFIIWPMPEGQIEDEQSTIGTMGDLAVAGGVESVQGMTYLPGDKAVEDGPSQIDAWIIETSSTENAAMLSYMVAGILSQPIAVIASENAITGSGDSTETLVAQEGFVTDDALPEGNAALVVRQSGTTIYAVVVYAPGDSSRRIADNVVRAMVDAPADGDVMDRFPQDGDGVLRGLVPSGSPGWAPYPSPAAGSRD